MKIRNILNLFFLAWIFSSLFLIQAMQINQNIPNEPKEIISKQDSDNKVNFKDYSKKKAQEIVSLAKRNKTFLIAFGILVVAVATSMFVKKIREHQGEQALKEDYHEISSQVLKTVLAFKYPGFKIHKIKNNPFEMEKNKKLSEFLQQKDLSNQLVELGRGEETFGPAMFKYNYIKAGNDLFVYPKK